MYTCIIYTELVYKTKIAGNLAEFTRFSISKHILRVIRHKNEWSLALTGHISSCRAHLQRNNPRARNHRY